MNFQFLKQKKSKIIVNYKKIAKIENNISLGLF